MPADIGTAVRVRTIRRLLVLLTIVLVVAAPPILYLRGGAHVRGSGGSITAPVALGDELHMFVALDTGGSDVELRSARVAGLRGDAATEVHLVRRHGLPVIGASQGPLASGYELLEVRGRHVRSSSPDDLEWLDVRVVPHRAGALTIRSVKVRYHDGLRRRTATLPVPACVYASQAVVPIDEGSCPLPAA
jgi:hypothetical protein